jgi:RNA polymerase sigma-70 factor (ECF subfamily)
VNEENKQHPAGAAASLDEVRQSVSSDLQYVSLQLNGKPYGGWYRVLPDGQMELLALANMLCERRPEKTPIEQARGMLTDFVRSTGRDGAQQSDPSAASNPAANDARGHEPTLGDLLYADQSLPRASEDEWVGLIKAIAAGDRCALDELYVRAHGIIYTLLLRLTGSVDSAEELTLLVFCDVWRQASHFDPEGGPVLAWLSNQARLRAIQRLEHQRCASGTADPLNQQANQLRSALMELSETERRFIEHAYFSRMSYPDLAAKEQLPTETVQSGIHSAMEQLTKRFRREGDR